MAPDPERIWVACQALLAAVVTHHGGDLPARQYVSAGPPAWDCPLVATWCERTAGYEGNPAQDATQRHSSAPGWAMRTGTFAATIVRNTGAVPASKGSTVKLPTVAQEEDAALLLYTDGQRMLQALAAAYRAGELSGCHSLVFLDWRVVGPDGGMVAGELRVRIGLVLGA